jgi:hypothetical protein
MGHRVRPQLQLTRCNSIICGHVKSDLTATRRRQTWGQCSQLYCIPTSRPHSQNYQIIEPETGEPPMERPSEPSNQTTSPESSTLAALMREQLAVLRRMDQRFEARGKCRPCIHKLVFTTTHCIRTPGTASGARCAAHKQQCLESLVQIIAKGKDPT